MSLGSVIICEFNPLHCGHKYIIEKAREVNGSPVIAVMSGNFTQRSECAIYDKYCRAAAAVRCGVDIVLELPFPWCSAGAEYFAHGGVSIGTGMGCENFVFGSESGDLNYIMNAARVSSTSEFKKMLQETKNEKMGAATLYDTIMKHFGYELKKNDKLAAEYIKAAGRLHREAVYTAVRRNDTFDNYKSASMLRNMICEMGFKSAAEFIPVEIHDLFEAEPDNCSVMNRLEELEFLYFRFFGKMDKKPAAEAEGGLKERLYTVAHDVGEYKDFYKRAATKRYTDSRIRRAALFSVLGVTKEMLGEMPGFTVLLAASRKGREYLSYVRDKLKICVITKPSSISSLDSRTKRQYNHLRRADELYQLCWDVPGRGGEFLRCSPYIDK